MENLIPSDPSRIDNIGLKRIVAAVLIRAVMDIREGDKISRSAALDWIRSTGLTWAETMGIDFDLSKIDRPGKSH